VTIFDGFDHFRFQPKTH